MSFYRQARFANAREIGQKTMNQCRFSNGKARIILTKKIKARESLPLSESVSKQVPSHEVQRVA